MLPVGLDVIVDLSHNHIALQAADAFAEGDHARADKLMYQVFSIHACVHFHMHLLTYYLCV